MMEFAGPAFNNIQKKILIAFLCAAVFSFVYFSGITETNFFKKIRYFKGKPPVRARQPTQEQFKSDKWIVITTIFNPTEDVRKMAEFKDWKIVVVADKKTPKNWTLKNCVFLSLEKQEELNYEIFSLVPHNSYTRKMIGYLYAIENGAKFIYDTDDDNTPVDLKLNAFTYSSITSGLVLEKFDKGDTNDTKNSVEFFNVYSHFGRPDIWPRGYPLDLIAENMDSNANRLCRQMKTPIIQQGLVNQDADVDAIYRMLFIKDKKKGLNVKFDSFAPPLTLPQKVYCPFNSQNTLFHYDAFWALMLPITVTFRVTDIWRGYWAQRLLHLTDNYLAFYPPNARQNRNPHSYLKDYVEETQLYQDSSKLVQLSENWNCKSDEFPRCVVELSEFMSKNDFWGGDDLKLTEAWINDLKSLGYVFPSLFERNESMFDHCRTAGFVSSLDKKLRYESQHMENVVTLNRVCRTSNGTVKPLLSEIRQSSFNHTKNVVLVVTFNHPIFDHIPLMQLLYERWFANVIFCGVFETNWKLRATSIPFFNKIWPWDIREKFSFVNLTAEEISKGFYHYMCVNVVAQMGIRNVAGYYALADDVLFNFWNPFNNKKVFFVVDSCAPNPEDSEMWHAYTGGQSLVRVKEFFETTKLNVTYEPYKTLKNSVMEPAYCGSDTFYVPQKSIQSYQILSQLFYDNKVFLELAVPKMMHLLGFANPLPLRKIYTFANDSTIMKGKYLWGGNRNNAFKLFNDNETFIHAVKFSNLQNENWRIDFCNVYIQALLEATDARDV